MGESLLDREAAAGSVTAALNYLADGSTVNRRFVAPGAEMNTGTYEPHLVTIRNARRAGETIGLDMHGFALFDAPSGIRDFYDSAEVDAQYGREIEAFIRMATGADRVVTLGWMLRSSGELAPREFTQGYSHQGGQQPPAGEVHVDMMPTHARGYAQSVYDRHFADGRPFGRFIATSAWRAFSPPPQDVPLAVCDARSVRAGEGVANRMIVCDALPDAAGALAPIADEDKLPAAAIFRFSPEHRWFYYPEMTRDELLLFKFHDSDPERACRCPHTAFRDPSHPHGTRESIELRSFAYFLA